MKLRSIATEDYPELLAMIKEMAEFMKMPEKVANSVDIKQQESEYLNGFVIEDEQAKLIGYTTFFMPITPGSANRCTWMICVSGLHFVSVAMD